ncbi:MAG: hypothetical protein ACM32E_15255 [Gemmatimonadota bacterium]
MGVDEQEPGSPKPSPNPRSAALDRPPAQATRPGEGQQDAASPSRAGRWWVAAAWAGGAAALLAVLVRISLGSVTISDGANPALQAWDILHGQVLLPGWIIADANYYTLELPVYALSELVFGLTDLSGHVGSALTYLIVAASAVAVAVTGSRGAARAARAAVVIAVLAAPLVLRQGVAVLVEEPDHIGTAAYLLAAYLLIDRAPARRFTPPLLTLILWAGQVGDATVRYVAVPAILLVCGYRMLAARKLRSAEAALAVAAAASVALALATRVVMQRASAYATVPPPSQLAAPALWPRHLLVTLRGVAAMSGVPVPVPRTALGMAAAVFGAACLAAAGFGFARVIRGWRTGYRAEQLLCATIVINLGVYAVSALPNLHNWREIAAVLPCGAVLAARALVPATLAARAPLPAGPVPAPRPGCVPPAGPAPAPRVRLVLTAAVLAAVLPLAAAAVRPPARPAATALASWLRAHGLRYGIAGYWDASTVTLESGNAVQVRAVTPGGSIYHWETDLSWYRAAGHDATFAVAGRQRLWPTENLTVADVERRFGPPAAVRRVAGREILIYRTNLLQRVGPGRAGNS